MLILFLFPLLLFRVARSVELTFQLRDSSKECFYEELKSNIKATLDYQVIMGGNYDVDVQINNPHGQELYNEQKTRMDSVAIEAQESGVYSICFSNEFSTFTDKLVFMSLQRNDEDQLPGISDHLTAMTQMESSASEIHQHLNDVIDHQTHHKVQEALDRKHAEELNERVHLWSLCISLIIPLVGLVQVWILKNFFAEKRPFRGPM